MKNKFRQSGWKQDAITVSKIVAVTLAFLAIGYGILLAVRYIL